MLQVGVTGIGFVEKPEDQRLGKGGSINGRAPLHKTRFASELPCLLSKQGPQEVF